MNAKRKPGIGRDYLTPTWAARITECVEMAMGRLAGKVRPAAVNAQKVTTTPTAAEFNVLVDDIRALSARINELLEQVQD